MEKLNLEISKLHKIQGIILKENNENFLLQKGWFTWCVKALYLEDAFKKEFKACGKELLIHFDVPEVNTMAEVNEYFLEIYDVNHPIRNIVETMDSIEEVRVILEQP